MALRQPAPYQSFLQYDKPSLADGTVWNVPGSTFKKWPRPGTVQSLGNNNGDDSFKVQVFNVTNRDLDFNISFKDGTTLVNAGPGPEVIKNGNDYKAGPKLVDADVVGDPVKPVIWSANALLKDAPTTVHVCSVSGDPTIASYTIRWRNKGETSWSNQAVFPIPIDGRPGKGKGRVQVVVISKRQDGSQVFADYSNSDFDCDYGCDNRCMNEGTTLPSDYFDNINDE